MRAGDCALLLLAGTSTPLRGQDYVDDDLPIGRPRSYALREGWMYGYDPNVYGGMTGRLGLSLNDIPGPVRG